MNILYVLNSGNYGGMEQHVLDLAKGMKSKGYNVFTWCNEGPIALALKDSGAEVYTHHIKSDIDPAYISKLSKFLKSKEIQIVHAHELKAVTNAVLAAFFAGVKVRITHTHTPISEWKINKYKKALSVFGYSQLINFMATTEIALTLSKKHVKMKEGISENKLTIVGTPNAINVADFDLPEDIKSAFRAEILKKYQIPENNFVWGFVSRISKEKGHDMLVMAFKRFLDNLPEDQKVKQHLLIAGGGPLEEEIKMLVKKYELEKQVTVTGRFSATDHAKIFASLDAFIHPSLAEGFGIALIEAMAINVPVLASDMEVFKEVGQDNVTFFKMGDKDDLAQKMADIYGDLEKYKNVSKKAQDMVKINYSMDKFVNDYEDFYLKLLNS